MKFTKKEKELWNTCWKSRLEYFIRREYPNLYKQMDIQGSLVRTILTILGSLDKVIYDIDRNSDLYNETLAQYLCPTNNKLLKISKLK